MTTKTALHGDGAWTSETQTTCDRCGTPFSYRNRNPARYCVPCRGEVDRERARAQTKQRTLANQQRRQQQREAGA